MAVELQQRPTCGEKTSQHDLVYTGRFLQNPKYGGEATLAESRGLRYCDCGILPSKRNSHSLFACPHRRYPAAAVSSCDNDSTMMGTIAFTYVLETHDARVGG